MSTVSGSISQVGSLSGSIAVISTISGTLIDTASVSGSISSEGSLSGSLSATNTISGSISASGSMSGELSVPDARGVESYTGEYTVTPKANSETVLDTRGYYMTDNVTVIEIPYYETSNVSGYTVYIADEV